MTRILGIDPGLRHCGWGVIDSQTNRLQFIAAGVIDPVVDGNLSQRLHDLYLKLHQVLTLYAPDCAVVEQTFLNKNPDTTLKLGHARGITLLTPALFGLFVHEYSAKQVKQSLVGNGNASKEQVQAMVRLLLPGSDMKSLDASDALAVAICHSHHASTNQKWLNPAFAQVS